MFTVGLRLINDPMNMIYDIGDPVEKANSVQQLHPMTSFASVALTFEKNPEVLDNMARYVSCSMEPGTLEMAKELHNRANELREEIYANANNSVENNTITVSNEFGEQAQQIREKLKDDEVLQEYYQFHKSEENEEVSKQR